MENIYEEYNKIIEADKGKSYLEILPAEFTNGRKNRSIINGTILYNLELIDKILKKDKYFKDIDIKRILRYAMYRDRNFDLAKKLFDNYHTIRLKPFSETEKDEFEDSLESQIQWLCQNWNQYESRQSIKRGELVNEYDMCKDGYPDTGRGCICYLYTPIVGDYPRNKEVGDKLTFFNPRTKKDVIYKVTGIKHYRDHYTKRIDIYKCLDNKGKEVFLLPITEMYDAYEALFSSNKEIYSGWWNKKLIAK